jgi:hypothetical protein
MWENVYKNTLFLEQILDNYAQGKIIFLNKGKT